MLLLAEPHSPTCFSPLTPHLVPWLPGATKAEAAIKAAVPVAAPAILDMAGIMAPRQDDFFQALRFKALNLKIWKSWRLEKSTYQWGLPKSWLVHLFLPKDLDFPRLETSFRDEILVLRSNRALGVPTSNAVMGLKKKDGRAVPCCSQVPRNQVERSKEDEKWDSFTISYLVLIQAFTTRGWTESNNVFGSVVNPSYGFAQLPSPHAATPFSDPQDTQSVRADLFALRFRDPLGWSRPPAPKWRMSEVWR